MTLPPTLDDPTILALLDRFYPDRSTGTLIWFALRDPQTVVHHTSYPIAAVPPPGDLFRSSLPYHARLVLPIRCEQTLAFDDHDRHLATAILFAGEVLDIPLLSYARASLDPPAVHQLPLLDLLWQHILARKFLDPPT